MMNRRKFLGLTAGATTMALAGCSQVLTQEAEPARFESVAVQESSYSLGKAQRVSSEDILTRVDSDLNKNVSAEGYVVSYYDEELPQSITAISTPSLSTFGRELNPIATSDTKDVLKLFSGRIRQSGSSLNIESIEEKETRDIETTKGEQTLEVFDVEMSSDDWDEVYFDFLVIKYIFDKSVVLTAAVILRDIASLPIDYANAYEAEKEEALRVLTQLEYPFDWSEVDPTNEQEE